MKKQILQLYRLTFFFLLLLITGCGGSGGSSDYTLSPDQLEVATIVEAFAAAVQGGNIENVMPYVDTNLKYPNLTTSGYSQFKDRLKNLFAKAEISEFTITGMGVDVAASDNVASVRGLLTLRYSIDGKEKPSLSESIELGLERSSKQWGIIQFAGHNKLMTTSFPPAL